MVWHPDTAIKFQDPKRASSISTSQQQMGMVDPPAGCQRPKRASSISTPDPTPAPKDPDAGCQRPKRASSISTQMYIGDFVELCGVNALNGLLPFLLTNKIVNLTPHTVCQRPKRASSISTLHGHLGEGGRQQGVNALNGLLPFLRYPLGTRINTGFPALFLQVFI